MQGAFRDGAPGAPAAIGSPAPYGHPEPHAPAGYGPMSPAGYGPVSPAGYGQPAPNVYGPASEHSALGFGYGYPSTAQTAPARRSLPDVLTSKVSRVRQFEGLRGYSTRTAIGMRYLAYFLLVTVISGVTEAATQGVKYASGGGKFMFVACSVIAFTGAVSTLFYVNLRNELVEKVRHYVFGIILIPGMLLALMLRALQEWEWANEGSLGVTLQAALPAVFLATVVLPTLVFVKEMLGIRTLHRTKLDDQEAVHLWTRQDGLQR